MSRRRDRFDGKVALVTGAGQGLGRQIALRLAAEGASVALAARSGDKLNQVAAEIREAGGQALPVVVDITDEGAVAAARDEVVGRLGAVDVLVNNSGIGGPTAPLWDQTLADWEETFRVNVTGTFLCCRAFLPQMLARNSGSIVIVGSMTGKRPLNGRTPYAASKTALIGLVRTLAWEVGPSGVRVNLVSPGAIDGPRLEGVLEGQAQAAGISVAEARAAFTSGSPLGRVVTADQVADGVLYLASDDAAAVTGEDLNVSAGAVMFG